MPGFYCIIASRLQDGNCNLKHTTMTTASPAFLNKTDAALDSAKKEIRAIEKTVRDAFDAEVGAMLAASGDTRLCLAERAGRARSSGTFLISSAFMHEGRPGFTYCHHNPSHADAADIIHSEALDINALPDLALAIKRIAR